MELGGVPRAEAIQYLIAANGNVDVAASLMFQWEALFNSSGGKSGFVDYGIGYRWFALELRLLIYPD